MKFPEFGTYKTLLGWMWLSIFSKGFQDPLLSSKWHMRRCNTVNILLLEWGKYDPEKKKMIRVNWKKIATLLIDNAGNCEIKILWRLPLRAVQNLMALNIYNEQLVKILMVLSINSLKMNSVHCPLNINKIKCL